MVMRFGLVAIIAGGLGLAGTASQHTNKPGTITISGSPTTSTVSSPTKGSSEVPIVFNATDSAQAGSVVSLQGYGFGPSPTVTLEPAGGGSRKLEIINRQEDWLAVKIPNDAADDLTVGIANGSSKSAPIKLNAARGDHLDSLEIVPEGEFRIFGRNLRHPGHQPSVTVNGLAARVIGGEEDWLQVVAPAGLRSGQHGVITVDNNNGSGAAQIDRAVKIIDGSGDPFQIKLGWTKQFAPLVRRSLSVSCNGNSASQEIQAAVDQLAAKGGGTVRIGAGNCTLTNGISLRSNIILQGAGKDATILSFTADYPLWADGLTRVAIRDLTLRNAGAQEGPLLKNNHLLVLQRIKINFGIAKQSFFTSNSGMVVLACEFEQPGSIGNQSPYLLDDTRGLVFQNNTTKIASGAASFERVSDAFISDNTFERSPELQNSRDVLHMMTVDFASHIAIIGNRFVSDAPITNYARNDGEAILTEGGGPNRTENLGTVSSASANTLYDPALQLNTQPFWFPSMPENYGVAIVEGKGKGQTRYVRGFSKGTITIDRDWHVMPDSSSRYATFVWGLEKAIIQGNKFVNMPRGIWLYQAAIRDVDISDNRFDDSGGIYLRAFQDLDQRMFDPIYNVNIARNSVQDLNRVWPAYISAVFVNKDARDFGTAMIGLSVYNNRIAAGQPNVELQTEEYAGRDGYFNLMRVENYDRSPGDTTSHILGTIFQNNECLYCRSEYIIGTGSWGTTIISGKSLTSDNLYEDWKTSKADTRSQFTHIN